MVVPPAGAGPPLGEPFCEAVLKFSTDEFPFAELALDLFRGLLPQALGSARVPLQSLHEHCSSAALRRRLVTQKMRLRHGAALDEAWRRFVRDVLRPHLGEEWLAFERSPNVRVHFAGQKAPVSAHSDSEHFHSAFEINFWVPLMDILDGSESLWAESGPGEGDFHPFMASYGEAVRFYGNKATHFTVDSRSQRTRVSFDARVVRGSDVARARLPVGRRAEGLKFLTDGPDRFTLFGYYGVMSASGEATSTEQCMELGIEFAVAEPVPPAEMPADVPVRAALPGLGYATALQEDSAASGSRPRSTSSEHARTCASELGSAREAQRACARCAWRASRARLLPRLRYLNAEGQSVPWVAEQPDRSQPWGLGCVPCARADELRSAPRCCFSDFSFGRAKGGRQPLLVKPLLRHGNHAAGQRRGGQLRIIQRNEAHAGAVRALGGDEVAQ